MAITRAEFIDKYGAYIAAVIVGGLASVFTSLFGSIGGGVALAMSLSRQCFLLVPLMLILPPFMGLIGVWWAAPISDVLSVLIALAFHLRERRRLDRLIAAQAAACA